MTIPDDSIFEEGLFAIPGVPILMDGCSSPELIRNLWDLMSWMKHIGKLDLKRGWCAVMESFIGRGGGRVPRELSDQNPPTR
jgi:hypothetical protein